MGTGYMGMDETPVVENNTTPAETTNKTVENTENTTSPTAETTNTSEIKEVSTPEKETVVATETKVEPQVVEKVIEKIVEKYPEFKDEDAKELYERFINGDTDSIYNYLSETKKNYDTMSDLDVIRTGLAKKNPTWTPQDVELEIRAEYGQQLEKYDLSTIDKDADPEEYREAVLHNQKADDNLLRVQRAARDNRVELKSQQKTIELPKIQKEEAAVQTGLTQEQIDESKRLWANDVEKSVPTIADLKFQVGDDKKPEEVVFVVTPEDKAALTESMKTWNGKDFMNERGWTNEDGTFNHLKIAEDVYALRNLNKIAKSVNTGSKVATTKEVIADIKNIDVLDNKSTSVQATPTDVGDLIWG